MPRHSTLLAPLMAAALCLGVAAGARPARAELVHDLSRTLLRGKTEKARIAAAVSLGRLHDPRAVKPLVQALDDESAVVRALAATALGMLGDDSAVPALQRANQDRNETVRRRAVQAIDDIHHASRLDGRVQAMAAPAIPHRADHFANYAIAPREQRTMTVPQVYLMVKSTQDESAGAGQVAARLRQTRANEMRSLMVEQLRRDAQVTLLSSVATPLGIEPYAVDVTIKKMERLEAGPFVEIACELRVTISNQRGKMLSFMTGGAKVQVPKRTFRLQYEPQLKREALENAVKSVHQDLIAYLRNRPS